MDWATQPDPFRRFAGTPELILPLAADLRTVRYGNLFEVGPIPSSQFYLSELGTNTRAGVYTVFYTES